MRQVVGGNGQDTTAATLAYLTTKRLLWLKTLYLIGESDDPTALWMTDYESPLIWNPWGTFLNADITRGPVSSKIGLEVTSLAVEWHPKPSPVTASIATANPYQLAQNGFYDNKKFRAWTVYMPTPGDANTLGASELFGGYISGLTVERASLKFTVDSFLNVVNELVPPNVIELTNTLAGYKGATPPKGFTQIPQFNVITGSTPTTLILDCTFPTAHHIFGTNDFQLGYVVFNNPAGATLAGQWSAVGSNKDAIVSAVHYNQVQLYQPLPWAPTPGVDTCFVSGAFPINQADGDYTGFPFVPDPTQAA